MKSYVETKFRIIRRNQIVNNFPIRTHWANEEEVRQILQGYSKDIEADVKALNEGTKIQTPKWIIHLDESYDL